MCIRGLIPLYSTELAEAVRIAQSPCRDKVLRFPLHNCIESRRGTRKFRQGVPDTNLFSFSSFSDQSIPQRLLRSSLKIKRTQGPIASRERSLPVFLMKPIATSDFSGWGPDTLPIPSGSPPPWKDNPTYINVFPGLK